MRVLGLVYLLLLQEPMTSEHASYPSWSPDGASIAFESTRDGDDSEIYVMRLETTLIVQLTDNDSSDGQPAWSPDGTRLVFVSERDGNQEIYRMREDGTEPTRLTEYPGRDIHPRFSFDARTILFNRERGSTAAVYEMSFDGMNVEPVIEAPLPLTFPSRSRDGARILLVKWSPPDSGRRSPNTDIALLSAESESPALLTRHPGFDGYPVWSADGTRIAFSSDRDGGRQQVFVMDADGSNVVQVTTSETIRFARPSWAPDGSRLVCTGERDGTSRLYVVTVPP